MEILELNDKTSTAWIDKYRPQKVGEIIGNSRAVYQITNWIKNFDANKKEHLEKLEKLKQKEKKKPKKQIIPLSTEENEITETIIEPLMQTKLTINNEKSSCLLVTGNHGVGKTCSVYAILNSLGYTIQIINFSRIKTTKNIKEIIDGVSNKNNILTNMFNKKNEKYAIVIDELESLSSQTEKICITALIKNNELYRTQPIIFISNNQHNKLLGDIKKISYEIKFWQPNLEDVKTLLQKITYKNNMKISNENVQTKLMEFCQSDLRRLVMILQDIKTIYNETKITEELIDEYISTAKKKDTDFDLFKATKNLLFNYDGIEESLRYYEIDKTTIPLMTQQNYIGCINEYTEDDEIRKQLQTAENISETISKADIIENFIHSEMNWDINIAHAFYSSIKPSYELAQNLMKERNIHLVYPQDLNKYSIKRINKINIDNVNKTFTNMDIDDYIYVNQIIRNQIETNKFKDCIYNFENYPNFKVETLERLLKVDKIKCSKTNLKSKEKKEISSYINKK